MGCSAPRDENRGLVVKEGTRMSYFFSGTSSHKVAIIDLQQNDEVQFSAYSNRQVNRPGLPFQNGENKESATSNTFERDIGIPFQTSDHNYGRVPLRSTESSDRLGIKKPERYHGVEIMFTNFQNICHKLEQLGIICSLLGCRINSQHINLRDQIPKTYLCLPTICIDTQGAENRVRA